MIGLYTEGKSKQVVGKALTSPGKGKRLFFNLGVASLIRGKGPGDIRYRFELTTATLPPIHGLMHQRIPPSLGSD